MNSVCDYCLNYEPINEDQKQKREETCSQCCVEIDEKEGERVCQNFSLVICPNISSAVVERFLKKDIDFYDNLCDLTSIILSIFSYQTIFKIIFNIEHGNVELLDMTNSYSTYGMFDITSIELKKGVVSFESSEEFKQLILSVIKPESLVFVEFEDFDIQTPIKGTFAKPNYLIKKNKLSLMMQRFDGQDVW